MEAAVQTEAQLKRKILFTPLETKEALHDWIEVFLGFDMPDSMVDETSNSSPLDSIWEIYDRCRKNEEDGFRRILSYASRMSFKTLGASILEVLMLFHLGRSVAHMAAIEGQAKKSQEYVKKFLRRPILREFVVGSNQRKVEIIRYYRQATGAYLSPKEWAGLPTEQEKDLYEQQSNYIAIVICTMAGANSEHVPFFVVDEVDVVTNPAAYQEAKAIPDTFDDKSPVTLLTSTRKFSYGIVQKEIDKASESDLQIRHWNILDVTQRCPDKRHRPDLPKLPIWRSDVTLRALNEDDYAALDPKKQQDYVKDEGFAGCLSNCKMFAACKGRLATHQKSTSKLLKKVTDTQAQFKEFSPDMAKAQLLCWKPSTEGLIYPRLDPTVHILTAAQIAKRITGDEYDKKLSKDQLLKLLQGRDVQWYAGMDFGFTHNFAVVLGVKDGDRMFIIHAFSQAEIELGEKLDLCESQLKPYGATIFPDMADPSTIKTFKRAGYQMRTWDKGKGTVLGGIEVCRLKLWPAVGQPQLFFLAEDEGVAFLFQRLQGYHWKTDAAGTILNEPDKEEDDECDAFRYLVMNVFAPKGKITLTKPDASPLESLAHPSAQGGPRVPVKKVAKLHWQQLMENAGLIGQPDGSYEGNDDPRSNDENPRPRGRKGGFHYDLG